MCKKQKYDVQCYNCGKKYNLKDLYERGFVIEEKDDYIICECENCRKESSQFFIYKGHGYKSHLVDI